MLSSTTTIEIQKKLAFRPILTKKWTKLVTPRTDKNRQWYFFCYYEHGLVSPNARYYYIYSCHDTVLTLAPFTSAWWLLVFSLFFFSFFRGTSLRWKSTCGTKKMAAFPFTLVHNLVERTSEMKICIRVKNGSKKKKRRNLPYPIWFLHFIPLWRVLGLHYLNNFVPNSSRSHLLFLLFCLVQGSLAWFIDNLHANALNRWCTRPRSNKSWCDEYNNDANQSAGSSLIGRICD